MNRRHMLEDTPTKYIYTAIEGKGRKAGINRYQRRKIRQTLRNIIHGALNKQG